MDIAEKVGYDQPIENHVLESLTGVLLPEYSLPWVENIFVPGHPCYEAYHNMHVAYDRLKEKLDVVDEDPDAEIMINSLLDYCDIIALKMFEYGRIYEQRRK